MKELRIAVKGRKPNKYLLLVDFQEAFDNVNKMKLLAILE
jgi:retron-type reverse transcriptase